MGTDYRAYTIIGIRLDKQEFDKLMDTEHQPFCCDQNIIKGHKYCPYCAKPVIPPTKPRDFLKDDDLIIPRHRPLKVIKDDYERPSIYHIGHSMNTYHQNKHENLHFLQAKPATMLFPTVWETLYAIGYEKPQNFGLYVVTVKDGPGCFVRPGAGSGAAIHRPETSWPALGL